MRQRRRSGHLIVDRLLHRFRQSELARDLGRQIVIDEIELIDDPHTNLGRFDLAQFERLGGDDVFGLHR